MTPRAPLLAIALCLIALLSLSASPTSAQSLSGVPRLSIATPLFELAHVETDGSDAQFDTSTRVSVGPRSALGFGVGVGVGEQVMLGAEVWLGHQSYAIESDHTRGSGQLFNVNPFIPLSSFGGQLSARWSAQLAPYLELVIGRGRVRPLLALGWLVGFQRDTLELSYGEVEHVNALQLGASLNGGAYFFLSDAISLDAALRMSCAYTGWSDARDQSATSVGLAATLGLSGWIR